MGVILEELSANFPIATTKDLTFYVSTTGNDTNDGLTALTPFKTIEKALSLIPTVVDHTVTINLADGVYAENVVITGRAGVGSINLIGNTTAPDNTTILTFTAINCFCSIKVFGIKITK